MKTVKVFQVSKGYEYGFVEGEDGKHIIITDDLIHFLSEDKTESLLGGYDSNGPKYRKITVSRIKKQGVDKPWADFVRYWGIKERICSNYYLLQDSMKEIGADTSDMPEWGA